MLDHKRKATDGPRQHRGWEWGRDGDYKSPVASTDCHTILWERIRVERDLRLQLALLEVRHRYVVSATTGLASVLFH